MTHALEKHKKPWIQQLLFFFLIGDTFFSWVDVADAFRQFQGVPPKTWMAYFMEHPYVKWMITTMWGPPLWC